MPSNNGFVWKTIRIQDLEWLDIESETLSYNCSCGDIFWTRIKELERKIEDENEETEYFEILQCESCSLKIKVVFSRKSIDEVRATQKI